MSMRCGPHDFAYEHSDIPPGMTLAEWREGRGASNRRKRAVSWAALQGLVVDVRRRMSARVRSTGGARSWHAAKRVASWGRQVPPFGSLRESWRTGA